MKLRAEPDMTLYWKAAENDNWFKTQREHNDVIKLLPP
jgi:hypothetical protein